MTPDVFVSYSSQDHVEVSKIIERLRKAGVSVWMDEGGIDAATLWSEAIVEAINDCKVLVIMVSRHSTDSANVVKEVMLASESSKTILPVYLEPADIPTRLKYQLTGIQHSEAYSLAPDVLLDELLRGLAKNGVTVPGYDVASARVSNATTHRKKRGRNNTWQTLAIIGMSIGGFVLGLLFSSSFQDPSEYKSSVTAVSIPTKKLKLNIPGDEMIPVGADNPLPSGEGCSVEISSSGRFLAYYTITNGLRSLNLRDLSKFSGEKKLISSKDLKGLMFSPDEKWIAYFENEKIRKISTSDGEVSIIAECRIPNYGCWAEDGFIYFIHELGRKLSRVKDTGGGKELLYEGPHQEGAILGKPFVLNDGGGVLMAFPGKGINRNYAPIKYLDLKSNKVTHIGVSGIWPYYHESGHLFFARNGNIWCVPFDSEKLKIKSSPVVIAKGVSMSAIWESANYSVSKSGAIAYLEGRDESRGVPAWVDLNGNIERTPLPEQLYGISDISPDGKKIAIQVATEKDDIWIYDTETWEGSRLTTEGSSGWPLWSKDGSSVVFVSRPLEEEEWALYSQKLNNVGSPQQIWKPAKGLMPTSWHPKENLLAVNLELDIWFIDVSKQKPSATKFADGDYLEWVGLFSPDGNWLAYTADKTGIYQIYVQSTKDANSIYQISGEENGEVIWASKGNNLYYFQQGSRFFRAEFNSTNPYNPIGNGQKLFDLKFIDNPGNSYDIHPDGKRFLFVVPKTPYRKVRDIRLILNFESELHSVFKE